MSDRASLVAIHQEALAHLARVKAAWAATVEAATASAIRGAAAAAPASASAAADKKEVRPAEGGAVGSSSGGGGAAAAAAAAALPLDERLLEVLRCSICVDTVRGPVTLSCGHSFCRSCVLPWVQRERNCPECRQAASSRLPSKNFMLAQLARLCGGRPDEEAARAPAAAAAASAAAAEGEGEGEGGDDDDLPELDEPERPPPRAAAAAAAAAAAPGAGLGAAGRDAVFAAVRALVSEDEDGGGVELASLEWHTADLRRGAPLLALLEARRDLFAVCDCDLRHVSLVGDDDGGGDEEDEEGEEYEEEEDEDEGEEEDGGGEDVRWWRNDRRETAFFDAMRAAVAQGGAAGISTAELGNAAGPHSARPPAFGAATSSSCCGPKGSASLS